MNRPALLLSAFSLAFLAAGCGQSGPLYLPGDPSEIQSPAREQPPQEDGDAGNAARDEDDTDGAEEKN